MLSRVVVFLYGVYVYMFDLLLSLFKTHCYTEKYYILSIFFRIFLGKTKVMF